MVFSSFQRGAIVASLGLALAACGGGAEGEGATAAGPEPEVIDERQANFKAIGDSFKAIREQLETESPDMAIITSAATDLNTAAGKIEGHFPEGTSVEDGYDTEALATIWQKPEEFAAAQQMLIDASAEMVTIAESGDAAAIGAQVGAVGKSCKNCHDQFRVDDD
ncbi:MAG: cytochrome c [Pseudomonadota bacterium]|nr:cytochrome c [Pseudomonadota bacterium]